MRLEAIASVLVSLAALAGATPAAIGATAAFDVPRLPGTTEPTETIPTLIGPLPAGDGVVYAVGRKDGAASVRLATTAGTRVVAAFGPKQNATLSLFASPTRLAAIRYAYVCNSCKYMDYRTTLDSLLAGPVGGPLTAIAQCEEGQPCAPTFFCGYGSTRFAAALGGELLAVRDTCTGSSAVRNLADGSTLQLGAAQAAAVGGPYVAGVQPRTATMAAQIIVRNGTTGAELYRSPVPPTVAFPITALVLLADGTVVYGLPQQSAGIPIVVATPAAPAGRVLRTVSLSSALIGAGPAGVLLATHGSHFELVPLDGGAAGRGFDVPDLIAGPAFDGSTITWARRTCVTTAISSWTLGTAAPPLHDLRCPTPRPSRAAVTLPRDRRLSVSMSCPASARGGCLAGVRLTAIRRRLPRRSNGAERSYRLGSVPVALDPGEIARAELLVPAGAARWVRRHAPLRLRIEARSERTASQRPPGEPAVVARTVALRAAR